MNSKAALSGGIGLVLVIAMIVLVVWLQPVRHFDGWWLLLPVVLIVAGIGALAMRGGAGRGR
ncbi:MAG TPA: hypothetical protein VJ183_09775 [Chloroflexia bacterium]|nr:hypothetical protein [Chloroflexia bacterium]